MLNHFVDVLRREKAWPIILPKHSANMIGILSAIYDSARSCAEVRLWPHKAATIGRDPRRRHRRRLYVAHVFFTTITTLMRQLRGQLKAKVNRFGVRRRTM
jgi:hypothetical protein